MPSGKIVAFALMAVAITEVTSWTIDLPLARKLFFSENKEENRIQIENNNNMKSYDNIEPNSFHNADYYYEKYLNDNKDKNLVNREYAEGYKHEGYMEKKVHDIVRKGSIYLDGLKRSLERYAEVLKNCSRINFNETQNSINTYPNNRSLPFPFPSFNDTQNSDFRTSNFSMSDIPIFNFTSTNISALNPGFSNRDSMAMCAEATTKREHIRRLTDLALWTTKRLEDNAYDAEYNKHHEQEENELLLKLSWFLDRIAHFTGFEPNVEEFVNRTTTPRPLTNLTSSFQLPFDNVPREVIQGLMDCMRANSSEPATERCRYPLPLPDAIQRAYEARDPRFGSNRNQDPSLSVIASPNSDPIPESSSLELLVAADSAATQKFAPKPASTLIDVKSVQKRSLDDSPLLKFMKYYGKHKVWVNSNAIDANDVRNNDNFEVPNQLPVKSVQKRSLFKKHIHFRIPEPLHALRDHIKKEAGIHYEKNKEQVKLIKGTLEKMRHSASLTVKHNLKKFDHVIKKIHKRSVHYGKKYLPRISEDPYQDLSYHSKNVRGVEYNYDPAQAALVRLGLEQIFQTGNIEVVRRYGSNFNPLDPNPFISGLLRASVDV